jgi:hypothetical protein
MPDEEFNRLDPSVVCHPILPANTPIDIVRFSSFVPLLTENKGKSSSLLYPTLAAMPEMFANVYVRSQEHSAALAKAVGQSDGISANWSKLPMVTRAMPNSVRIASLGELFASGSVTIGADQVKVNLNTQAIKSLTQGKSTRIQLRDPDSNTLVDLTIEPDYTLPAGRYFVSLDEVGQAELLNTGFVQVANVGRKRVKLDSEAIQNLLTNGECSAVFKENAQAKLEIYSGNLAEALSGTVSNTADVYAVREARLIANLTMSPSEPLSFRRASTTSTGGSQPPPPTHIDATDIKFPEFPMVLYMPYIQEWKLDGYARGALLNVLSLAPQEETTIEVMSYDRRKRESETTRAFEFETAKESTVNNKDTTEVIDDARRDNGWKFDVGATVSIPSVPINASFGIKDELTKSTKATVGQITDATTKASTKIKATRQTKVLETSDIGSENKAVRKLRNPNLGRTLNLDAFEVVAHYTVNTRVDMPNVRLGVLVEMYDFLGPILHQGKGHKEMLLSFESALTTSIPTSLHGGFAAARMLLANERVCSFKCMPACSCDTKASTDSGAATTMTDVSIQNQLSAAIQNVVAAVNTIESAGVENLGITIQQSLEHLLDPDPASHPPESQFAAGRLEVKRFLYRRVVLEGPAQRFWSEAQKFAKLAAAGEAEANRLINARTVEGLDALNAIAAFVTWQFTAVSLLADIIGSRYPLVAIDMVAHLGFDDAGLESSLDALKNALDSIAKSRQGASTGDGKSDGKTPPPPPPPDKPYADKDLAEASVELDAMLCYLSNNANFFRSLLWRSINPADQLRFLKIYGRLRQLVTGRILGFIGTAAVIEVDLTRDKNLAAWYEKTVPADEKVRGYVETFKTVLPTPGVTLEARLGACDALEPYLVQSRATELDRVASVAVQEAQEVERLKARIKKGILDDPKPAATVLKVQTLPPGP